jgi:uncharacterized protein YunC (DUF1805 family)
MLCVKLKVFATISITTVKVEDRSCLGLRADLPDSPPLLLITAEKGFVMCGFLNVEAAERLGVAAAVVSGVKTFEDVLRGGVKAVTSKARSMGVEEGMNGADALKHMC